MLVAKTSRLMHLFRRENIENDEDANDNKEERVGQKVRWKNKGERQRNGIRG